MPVIGPIQVGPLIYLHWRTLWIPESLFWWGTYVVHIVVVAITDYIALVRRLGLALRPDNLNVDPVRMMLSERTEPVVQACVAMGLLAIPWTGDTMTVVRLLQREAEWYPVLHTAARALPVVAVICYWC